MVIGSCVAALLAMAALRYIPFNNDIEVMLPRQAEVLRDFHFFRESPLAKTVAVSFQLKSGKGTQSDLVTAVDQFSAKVHSPMITRVLSGLDSQQSLEEIQAFVRLAPQLMEKERLETLDAKLTPVFVQSKLEKLYRALLSPTGSFLIPIMQQDPLGLQAKALRDLRDLHASLDYDVQLQAGHLISRDGRHALVVLETNVSITDGSGSKKLIGYLNELLEQTPALVSVTLIAGHLHAISNEKIIKRDILVTSTVSSIAFLLIFILLFKDLRALLLFSVPLLSVLLSVPICAWLTGKLSFVIMGMGAVIAGIADDYCIHVYMAMQSGQSRKEAMGEVSKTVATGAFTTCGVFSVFLFSKVPGYRELALLTIVSLLLSLGFALFVLPHFLILSKNELHQQKEEAAQSKVFDKPALALWSVLMLACLMLLPSVHFQTDVKQYDGSEPGIFKAEETFRKDWGEKTKPAILVVKAPSLEGALQTHARLRPAILAALGKNKMTGLAEIWPAAQKRTENIERWNQFWDEIRQRRLHQLFKAPMDAYGFADNAFEGFFKTLHMDAAEIKNFERLGLLAQLKHRFAFETKDGYRLVSFFPDEEKLVNAMNQKIEPWPDVFVVSARRFTELLSAAILSESVYMACAIAFMILATTCFFLRNVRLTLIALVPVVTSILFIFSMGTVLKIPLNAASMIALLVVGGLCIDSGIFMVNYCHHHLKTNTRRSVTLSTLTTIIGAGTLVFAKHPVLFSYGTTLAIGITAGYLTAMYVVPALYRLGKWGNAAV